jgi:hypothetical protein
MPRRYQPQQSVLNPQVGQRQTACIRNISAWPQRSQIIRSVSEQAAGCGRLAFGPAETGDAGFVGSGMSRL